VSGVAVDPVAAAAAALLAGALMEGPLYLQRAAGRRVYQDVFAEGGALLGVRGPAQRVVGYLGHAVLSVVIALLYAVFFQAVARDHLLVWGAFGGLVHFTVGALVVGAAFPVLTKQTPADGSLTPGVAYARYGRRDVLTFFGGHLLFGLLFALLYSALHPELGARSAV
jgi:hypothetical protein